jgi:oligopeptidase B
VNQRKHFSHAGNPGKSFTLVALITVLSLVPSMSIWFGCSSGDKEDVVVENKNQALTLPQPPKAEKIKKELTLHQHTRVDNYYWLNQRDNPKVIEYLKAENDYLKAVMKHTEALQEKLFNEIIGRIKKDDSSVPYKTNGYYYYSRYQKGKEYPLYCRRKESMAGPEEIMLDVNAMAKGHNYFQVTGLSVSPDNTMLAYGVDTVSRRKYTIHFKNLVTGEIIPGEIPNATAMAAWANDNKTVFYTSRDETLRPYKIFRHVLGTPVSDDKEIYHEADETFTTDVYKSKSKKYLIISSEHILSTECRYLDADDPHGEFKIFQPRERDNLYSIDHYKDKFYIRTNLEAENFKLMETPVNKTTKDNWRDVISHRNDVLLEGFEIFKDFLVVKERKNALTHLRVIKLENKEEHYIDFDEEVYVAYISKNPEFDTHLLRFEYTSLTTSRSHFDYNMNDKTRKLLKQDEVVGDFDPQNYKTERLYATAADNTKIPISLVYKKGLKKDGNNPLLLYGYGSYGYSMNPNFRSDRLSLVDRGFVFAIAHIRGGQEMGRYWYEEGKLLNKKNTFTDFIACAEHLTAEKFTNPKKLFATGGSAGGLLMGAIANMRPHLFKGIIASVPFVDVITTMLDDSIPLTTSEFDEWGNPKVKKYYDYMLSYSPYDNVKVRDYPAMLVITGLHDSQVQYFEPAKWAAKLRDLKTDNNLLLLHTNMEAGHSGTSGRFRRYKETALQYAFILDQLGIGL